MDPASLSRRDQGIAAYTDASVLCAPPCQDGACWPLVLCPAAPSNKHIPAGRARSVQIFQAEIVAKQSLQPPNVPAQVSPRRWHWLGQTEREATLLLGSECGFGLFCYVGDRIAPAGETAPQRKKTDLCFPYNPSVSRAGMAAGASRTEWGRSPRTTDPSACAGEGRGTGHGSLLTAGKAAERQP